MIWLTIMRQDDISALMGAIAPSSTKNAKHSTAMKPVRSYKCIPNLF